MCDFPDAAVGRRGERRCMMARKRHPIYVSCMGELFRLSRRAFKSYLRQLATTGAADLNDYGTRVAGRVYDLTDINRAEALTILAGGRCSWLPTLDEDREAR